MRKRNAKLVTMAAILAVGGLTTPKASAAEPQKNMAQKVVEEIKAAHTEITSLELAATRSEKEGCKTIAATEAKEIGQKCDKDELTAMKTNKPFVEQEKDEFDATLPIHDAAGKMIGTVGMDFKTGPEQTKETVTRQAKQIVAELEKRITTKDRLFEPAK
jgi:hypothetical protein